MKVQRATLREGLIAVAIAIGCGLALAGCAASGPGGIDYASGAGSVTPDGLHRIKWEPFSATFVKPGADLQRYDKVLLEEVTVSYKTPPRPGHSLEPNYALPPAAVASLKRYFHDAFAKELAKSANFSVTDAAGPDVLLISGHIVDLQVSVPPQRDLAPDETDFASSSGQMTLVLDARDSVSGEPMVRVGQRNAIQMADGGWYQSDPVSNSIAVRQILDTWASSLRRELDQFHALPELPATADASQP